MPAKTLMGLERFEIIKKKCQERSVPGQELSSIKKAFSTIEALPIGFICVQGILVSQNSYGYTAI